MCMVTSGNIAMAMDTAMVDTKSLTPLPDPVAAMLTSARSLKEARRKKIALLKEVVKQRTLRRNNAIINNKDIRDITAKIEENNISILKIHNMNSVLEQSRSHYIEEAMKEFDEQNPSEEQKELYELEVLEARDMESEYQQVTRDWGSQTTVTGPPWNITTTHTADPLLIPGRNIRYGASDRTAGPF